MHVQRSLERPHRRHRHLKRSYLWRVTSAFIWLQEMQGVLFAEGDVSPRIAQTIDLSHIHGRRLHRLWTTLHDALIYVDPLHTRSKVRSLNDDIPSIAASRLDRICVAR